MASQRPLTVAARNDVSPTVLPLTSDLYDMPSIRVTVEPGEGTGLRLRSQVVVDKVMTIPRAKAGTRIGRLDEATLASVGRALAALLGVGWWQAANHSHSAFLPP